MSASLKIQVNENSHDRNAGIVWHQLQSERAEICEELLKEFPGRLQSVLGLSEEAASGTTRWHLELLQSRLRKIDDALDRLMAGSYGYCCRCGKPIEETKMDLDPAIAFCGDCWRQKTHTRW